MGGILGILLVVGMCYVIYQHYVAPFKAISRRKTSQKYVEEETNKINATLKDDVFKRRQRFADEALDNKLLTQEEYDEIVVRMLTKRQNDLFGEK